jgi:hypothetical protein
MRIGEKILGEERRIIREMATKMECVNIKVVELPQDMVQ